MRASQLAPGLVLPIAHCHLPKSRLQLQGKSFVFVQRPCRLDAASQVTGIDCIQMNRAESPLQILHLTQAVFCEVAVVLTVETAVDIALRLAVAYQINCCHGYSSLYGMELPA